MSRWEPAQSVGARDPAVFGFRVLPLTLGHVRLLDELGLNVGTGELAEAVTVCCLCSQPHHESRRDLRAFWFGPLMRWRAHRAGLRSDLVAELKAFREWSEFHLTGPSAKRRGDAPKGALAAPLYFNLTASLMGSLGMTLDAAENLPVKTARQLLAAFHEAAGRVELWTEREYAFEAWCQAADRHKREQQATAN